MQIEPSVNPPNLLSPSAPSDLSSPASVAAAASNKQMSFQQVLSSTVNKSTDSFMSSQFSGGSSTTQAEQEMQLFKTMSNFGNVENMLRLVLSIEQTAQKDPSKASALFQSAVTAAKGLNVSTDPTVQSVLNAFAKQYSLTVQG